MTDHQSQDRIGLWPLTSLVTGNLVGSGVYLLPTTLAIYGSISLFGWLITACGAILLSLVFAQLSSYVAKTGGPYLYAREAFGDTVGYFVAWGYWMLSWMSNPALAVAAVGYISMLCGGLDPITSFMLEVLIVVSLMSFNFMGIKITGRAELFLTVIKVLPLLILPVICIFFINPDYFVPTLPDGKTFGQSLNSVAFLTLWAFVGLETGTVPAGQVTNAKKIVPLATILGTLIAALVYIVGTVAVMGVVPPEQLIHSHAPYADVAHNIFGGSWSIPVAIAAIITCLGTLNGWILVVGRIPYGASEDGLFPSVFQKTTKHGTPYWGILISSLCSFPLLLMSLQGTLLQQFNFIIDVAVTLILLVYAVSVLAYLTLLIRNKTYTFGKVLLGLGALSFSLWALWAASFKMVGLSLIIVVLGVPMFLWMKRAKRVNR